MTFSELANFIWDVADLLYGGSRAESGEDFILIVGRTE